jgi:hypothetical protein
MNMHQVIARITERLQALGISESEASIAAGSRDLIRNWRRALGEGRQVSARHQSLVQISNRLGVSADWLINGTDDSGAEQATPPGFAEAVTPFVFTETQKRPNEAPQIAAVRAVMAPSVGTPATFKLHMAFPHLGLAAGDVVIVDMSVLPKNGDLALVSIDHDGHETTTIALIAEPWAIAGPMTQPILHRLDSGNIIVRHAMTGIIRQIDRQER